MAFTPTSPTSGNSPTIPFETDKKQRRLWHPFAKWLGREEQSPGRELKQDGDRSRPSIGRKLSRRVVPGLPRPPTFKRQQSERRERLTPVGCNDDEKRALSVDRKRARAMSARPSTPPPAFMPKPATSMYGSHAVYHGSLDSFPRYSFPDNYDDRSQRAQSNDPPTQRPAPPPSPPPDTPQDSDLPDGHDQIDEEMKRELEERWILNLSMHFRDRSPREKFFVTYAETPTRWRRVTVSIDYRDAPPDSLERDLQTLQYQRDKSARIYEAIRASLLDIQFYETVTNLRLETSPDDRLHVHVTEDVNEIIQYPSINLVQHLDCKKVSEDDVHFDSHMSGFVYKVQVDGQICIKKEIPGPDSVEEFLYEINALHSLIGSTNVVQFEGLVVDEKNGLIKGLLIGYADKGPLVDLIYDDRGHLPWGRREKWASEIVNGLAEIHEAGFVQGDFTLSNIVIDEHDKVRIIDINRRGCPVGWEPPEIARMIESGQRISMYIGVKSDLFQLGMVLWALAEEEDEPERQTRPLSLQNTQQPIPEWYRELTARCLSADPRDRLSARTLYSYFQDNHQADEVLPAFREHLPQAVSPVSLPRTRSHSRSRPSETQYIDPATAISRDDLPPHRTNSRNSREYSDSHTYFERPSSLDIPFDGPSSYFIPQRGRTPPVNSAHLRNSSYESQAQGIANAVESDCDPQIVPISPGGDYKWDEIEMEGCRFLIDRERSPEGRAAQPPPISTLLEDRNPDRDSLRTIEHVDSSFADGVHHSHNTSNRIPFADSNATQFRSIEHIDSGLGDMDLSGIGENEEVARRNAKQEPQIGSGRYDELTIEESITPQGSTAAHAENKDEVRQSKEADDGLALNDSIEEPHKSPEPQDGKTSFLA